MTERREVGYGWKRDDSLFAYVRWKPTRRCCGMARTQCELLAKKHRIIK